MTPLNTIAAPRAGETAVATGEVAAIKEAVATKEAAVIDKGAAGEGRGAGREGGKGRGTGREAHADVIGARSSDGAAFAVPAVSAAAAEVGEAHPRAVAAEVVAGRPAGHREERGRDRALGTLTRTTKSKPLIRVSQHSNKLSSSNRPRP
eukprot:88335_1